MGLSHSKFVKRNGVNYDCPMCKLTNRTPNILGKFFIIDETTYKCNACENVFKREYCPKCKKPFKIENLAGSFFIIKNNEDCNC